ncbi:uracil-DNA glycosylase family protein, partial [Kitasatospora sp. NPDC051914]|uniref:uracil-DNA glycosylase family protein n=1 Tax=Kitasatospora sp. NPDC051914 TaxID=3154945 RepID=UPI00343C3E89
PVAVLRSQATPATGTKPPERVEPVHHFPGRNQEAGIAPSDVTPWNACPWYINRSPNAAELQAGAEVLKQLLGLMPKAQVVLLQGNQAQDVWRRLLKTHPEAVRDRSLEVVSTYHPGRQALFVRDPEERVRRAQHRIDSYQKVGDVLRSTGAQL